jgi:hypothetical protein
MTAAFGFCVCVAPENSIRALKSITGTIDAVETNC